MIRLKPLQEKFCQEYLIDLKGTKAAIRAGYSARSAGTQACRLLKMGKIQARIAQLQQDRSDRTEITQDMVLQELARIGFSDVRSAMTADGKIIDPSQWSSDVSAAISTVEVVTSRPARGSQSKKPAKIIATRKFRMWDKVAALEKLGRHLGMFQGEKDVGTSDVASALEKIADKLPG